MSLLDSLITDYGLASIFIAAFLSYSIFPIPPIEPLIILSLKHFNAYTILITSILGSTFGSILNYIIGLKGIRVFLLKKFSKTEKKARKIFEKFGPTSIVLLGWAPVVGNPLVIVAGTLKMKFWKFLIYSTLGKIWYFIFVIWFGSYLTALL